MMKLRIVILFVIVNMSLIAKEDLKIKNTPKCETVVCIHGFLRSKYSMSRIASSFRKEGFSVINWGYYSRKRNIFQHADLLVKDLQIMVEKHPGKTINFVTHSLGGLIARSVLNHPKCPREAKQGRVVLLAPPNQGSLVARKLKKVKLIRNIFGSYAGKELMIANNFDYLGDFSSNIPVLIIAGDFGYNPILTGKNDGKVAVDETFLSTPHEHEIVHAGHSWISYNSKAINLAKKFIMNQ